MSYSYDRRTASADLFSAFRSSKRKAEVELGDQIRRIADEYLTKMVRELSKIDLKVTYSRARVDVLKGHETTFHVSITDEMTPPRNEMDLSFAVDDAVGFGFQLRSVRPGEWEMGSGR